MSKQMIWDNEKQEFILTELSEVFPMKVKPKVGDIVKFKDNLWEQKKIIALGGGLFGPPMDENHENKFVITRVNNQGDPDTGEDDFELGLKDYPWLVYFDEMELVDVSNKS